MGIWGNLEGTFKNRFSFGKKKDEVYAERRTATGELTVRDLVITAARTVQDLLGSDYTLNGFFNLTDSTISRNDGIREFKIQPSAASFEFYSNAIKYKKSVAQTKTWSVAEGTHYFYFDESGVLQETTVFSEDLILKYALVAILYWDAANSVSILFCEERHGLVLSNQAHLHFHLSFGCQWKSGLSLQSIIPDGSGALDAHAEFAVENGAIRDEDLEITITDDSPQNLSPIAQIPVYWRTGANGYWRKKTADNFPLVYSGSGGYVGANGRAPYNQWTGAVWQLTEIAQDDCVLVHYFGTNNVSEPVIAIQGQAKYSTVGDARIGANTEMASILFGVLPTPEFTPLASVIFQSSSVYGNTPKARVRTTDTGSNYIDFRKKSPGALVGVGVALHSFTHQPGGTDQVPYGSIVAWGDNSVVATTTTRYLTPYYHDAEAQTSPIQFRVPRAGLFRNLRVRHNSPNGNGNAIVYTLRVEGIASALSVSLASTAADGSDLVNSVSVANGNRIDIEVTKALAVGTSPNDITATAEFI